MSPLSSDPDYVRPPLTLSDKGQVHAFEWEPGDMTRYEIILSTSEPLNTVRGAKLYVSFFVGERGVTMRLPEHVSTDPIAPSYIREKSGLSDYESRILSDFLAAVYGTRRFSQVIE